MERKRRVAILTGGGDCPGINAVIRAFAKQAMLEFNMEVIGIEDGYDGLVHNRHRILHWDDVSGIITLGGTILGTSNTANPYHYAVKKAAKLDFVDVSAEVIANFDRLQADCLACVGGDGTMSIANRLSRDGVPVVGIPKTIDNDLLGTDITFGFDSAVSIAAEGIDRIHTTAQSHHRAMIVEVMGRNAGWLALYSGVAGGGDIILIPEIPYNPDIVAEKVKHRSMRGKRFTIVVVAEGAKPEDGDVVIQRVVKDSTDPVRLGGIGFVLGAQIENLTGIESRTVVMGHLLRGGSPTAFDRILATRLGTRAVDMVAKKACGSMVAVQGSSLAEVPLQEVASGLKRVLPDNPLLRSARAIGTSFGDLDNA